MWKGFDWRYVCSAFLTAEAITTIRLSFKLSSEVSDQTSSFVFLAGIVLGGLFVACLVFGEKENQPIRKIEHKIIGAIVCLILSHSGFAIVILFEFESTIETIVVLLACALWGGFAVLACFIWMQLYIHEGSFFVLLYAALSLVLSAFLIWIVVVLPNATFVIVALTICSTAGLAVAASLQHSVIVNDDITAREQPSEERQRVNESLPALFRLVMPYFLGLCLCAFNCGAIAIPGSVENAQVRPSVYLISHLAFLAIAIALLASFQGRAVSSNDVARRLYYLVPVCIVAIGVFSFVRMLDASGTLKFIISVPYRFSFAALVGSFVTLAAMRCRELYVSPDRFLAISIGVFFAFYVLGIVAMELIGNTALYIQVFLSLVLIMTLALMSPKYLGVNGKEAELRQGLEQESELGSSIESIDVEARCVELASKFGLTVREREVLALLVEGCSSEDISERLFISPQTVNTHRKHIYAKLDVHRYQELLKQVYLS